MIGEWFPLDYNHSYSSHVPYVTIHIDGTESRRMYIRDFRNQRIETADPKESKSRMVSWLEFELTYYNISAQHINYFTTGTFPLKNWRWLVSKFGRKVNKTIFFCFFF